MIEYLIESTVCLALFYIVFTLLLKSSTNYKINRAVLLFSVLFSLIVPLLDISTSALPIPELESGEQILQALSVPNYLPEANLEAGETSSTAISFSSILLLIYAFVVLILFVRFAWHLMVLLMTKYLSEKSAYQGHQLVLLHKNVSPFTFFNSIFINKTQYQSGMIEEELLVHEIAHKKQKHSIDVLTMELLQVFYWFNPFIFLFKRLIKVNHEFLADDFVLRSGTSFKDYTDKLLHHSFPQKMSGFSSGFNHLSLIKQRLMMLSKFQEKKPGAYRFLLLIPVVILLFTTTAFKSTNFLEVGYDQVENNLDIPGIIYATSITWSSQNNEILLRGRNVKIKHGDNNFHLNGTGSYLGQVNYFVFNGKPATKDSPINIEGKKCEVVKLSIEKARRKYGAKGRLGAVEIKVLE